MRLLAMVLLLCYAGAAAAQTSEDARKELSSTLNDLKASRLRQKQLEEKHSQLENELKILQGEMVALARDTGRQEEDLTSYEEKLRILEEQKHTKTIALTARRQELSAMLSAMVKLKRMPPEAVIAMPGKLGETLAAARALSLITHAIEDESASLAAQLSELNALEEKIRKGREVRALGASALEVKRKRLAEKVKERAALQAQLGGKQREERQRAARLTAKSETLQELVDALEKSEHAWFSFGDTGRAVKKAGKKSAARALRPLTAAKGALALPAAGRVIGRYGATDLGSTFAKGLVIATRAGAQVTAPFDGEVVFAGHFRDYGRLVIIRHGGGYHTLLSGLEAIHCTPGQFLLEGEPVGVMGEGGEATHLYLELRQEGKPVDPAGWLKF